MATTKKGWRRITVDQKQFRWMIRREPKYWDNHWRTGMRFTVESVSGSLLVVNLGRPRLDYWWPVEGEELKSVTPSEVADWIKKAIALHWDPEVKTKPFVLSE